MASPTGCHAHPAQDVGLHTFINHKNDNMALMDIMKSYNHSAPGITLRYIGMDEEHRKEMCMGFEIKGEETK